MNGILKLYAANEAGSWHDGKENGATWNFTKVSNFNLNNTAF